MGAAGTAVSFYEGLYAKHGDSPRSLDWSEKGQRARFSALRKITEHPERSVLDVGCGLGHFFDWCTGRADRYTGVDVSPTLIAAAKQIHPAGRFDVLDAMKDSLPKADYVVSSGMLNTKPNNGSMFVFLQRCFDACNIACAVNMLSNRAPNIRKDRIYRSPEAALQLALKVSSKVTLRHDYLPNDFTLVLYK